jgi:hypothetical protein
MEGQMTIFDFLGDFGNMSEEKLAEAIGSRLGIKFKQEVLPNNVYRCHPEYEYKHKGLRLTVSINTDWEGKSFVSCGYNKGMAGGGAPIYSLNEAVEWFQYIMELWGENKKA